MKLTEKELEIMHVLWKSGAPMTGAEIIAATEEGRTWKESSFYIIMKSLLAKKAVAIDHYKPYRTRHAGAFNATITVEKYGIMYLKSINIDPNKICAAFAEYAKSQESGKIF